MGLGIISGAMKSYGKNKKGKPDKKSKENEKYLEELKKKLDELYKKYKENSKDIPDWARRTDPTLVGIEMQITELQDKISIEEERLGMVI